MTRKVIGAVKSFLRNQSGQTMLEYVVIVVFVCIVMYIAFSMVGPTINRGMKRTSTSIEQP